MNGLHLLERLLYPNRMSDSNKVLKATRDRVIVITGATSGIGNQLAFELSEYPVTLILTGRNEEELVSFKAKNECEDTRIHIHVADLRDPEQLEGFIRFLSEFTDGIDYFINNVGLSIHRPVLNSLDRAHDFERTMGINYFSPVKILLRILPLLIKRKGHIINVSTINVLLSPMKHWAVYQASKAAFDTWLRSATPELKEQGVSVSTIYLSLVRTPMIKPTKTYAKMPAMSTEQATHEILRLMYTRKRLATPWWLFWKGGIR